MCSNQKTYFANVNGTAQKPKGRTLSIPHPKKTSWYFLSDCQDNVNQIEEKAKSAAEDSHKTMRVYSELLDQNNL